MRSGSLAEQLKLSTPVINAPMIGVAGGELAAAVSNAGGLGLIGIEPKGTEDWFAQQFRYCENPDKPWGVGFIGWSLTEDLAFLRHVLSHQPHFMSASFVEASDPRMAEAFSIARDLGIITSIQAGSAREVDEALEADVDVVVVRGSEGGGHGRNEVATLPLLQYAKAATDKPVIAAGGIGTARGVAAALAAGADAAWVGTRFITARESLTDQTKKSAVGNAGLDDTIYTNAFDIAQKLPWDRGFGGRALKNAFAEEWAGREDELQQAVDTNGDITQSVNEAKTTGNLDRLPIYAGEAAAFTKDEGQTVAEIMEELDGFRIYLQQASNTWGTKTR
ncbi:NAD(P)H-dependent flavin oxidoreductase [Neomicrococcus lactis]|uniref:Nitronate monooxygenase n=1 Tax=Neomicrococcus lactis TaxID=732241 RepID=A0A7W8YCB2_9MICC|nr:nitronate monooxygenase [Neomicrococcus lactis]MBB5598752.1 nitronate monooxygenase [Neomicrococcus lactis]